MPEVDLSEPVYMDLATLKIDVDNYEAAISSATFTPNSSVVFNGINGKKVSRSKWQLAVEHAQDWETAESLSNYLHAHEGESKTVVLVPTAGGPSFTATIAIAAGTIGGAADTLASSSVTFESSRPIIAAGA